MRDEATATGPRLRAGKSHVGIDREPDGGNHILAVEQIGAGHAARVAKTQPRLDAAFISLGAVVFDDPVDPLPANIAERTVGENRRILDRDVDLIIETVGHPSADGFLRKPAFIHQEMKRMLVVIAARADLAQFADKCCFVPK